MDAPDVPDGDWIGDSLLAGLGLMALLGGAMVWLFPGSPEQDAGYHFWMARAVRLQPEYLVKVWARPLFTAVFAFPAVLGPDAARLFAVAIGLGIAWQSMRLAEDLKLGRAWLVVPLLLAQPSFFELYTDFFTEPLFALVFVVALRWQLRGWKTRGMLAASLLPLARPEGVFLCLLWGVWLLVPALKNRGTGSPAVSLFRAVFPLPLLASGVCAWWLAALVITGDPLFILHDWPRQWQQGIYGQGSFLAYAARSWEFAGPLLLVPLLAGLAQAVRRRDWLPVISSWLLFFILHSIFRKFGLFGEAGYPRYMVSVAPATVVLTLAGWNKIAAATTVRWPVGVRSLSGGSVLALSILISFFYLDSMIWARDATAIREMQDWAARHQSARNERLVWCNVLMSRPGETRDFLERPALTSDHQKTLAFFRESPSGTMVMWDDKIGPDWFGVTIADIQSAGYELVRERQYALPGVVLHGKIAGWQLTREIELGFLRKR